MSPVLSRTLGRILQPLTCSLPPGDRWTAICAGRGALLRSFKTPHVQQPAHLDLPNQGQREHSSPLENHRFLICHLSNAVVRRAYLTVSRAMSGRRPWWGMLLAGARWAAALGSSGCPSTASATSAAAAARAPGDGPRSCHQTFSVVRKNLLEAISAKGKRVHQQRSQDGC